MGINKKGFTLIELLVSVAILAIVALAANSLFFYTLKGGKKTDIKTKIKQNGSYALASMANRIRSAAGIVSCGASSLEIQNYESGNIIFGINANNQIASNSTALTSSDLIASALSFSCTLTDEPPTVSISFILAKTIGAQEEQGSENFQTTVSLRNY